MFQAMLNSANKISTQYNNHICIVQIADTYKNNKAYNEWYKPHTSRNYHTSIYDNFYRKNNIVTPDDWHDLCFAIRFAEIAAIENVTFMTCLRIDEETKLIESMNTAYATEAILIMANAIDDAWVQKAMDLVAVSQERVNAARDCEAGAVYTYHTANEKTKAIEMMEEVKIAETMSWVWEMTHMDNHDKWWSFESENY